METRHLVKNCHDGRRDEWRQDKTRQLVKIVTMGDETNGDKTKTISKKIVTMGDETNGDKMDWR